MASYVARNLFLQSLGSTRYGRVTEPRDATKPRPIQLVDGSAFQKAIQDLGQPLEFLNVPFPRSSLQVCAVVDEDGEFFFISERPWAVAFGPTREDALRLWAEEVWNIRRLVSQLKEPLGKRTRSDAEAIARAFGGF